MLWSAYMQGDIEGKTIADLGCGTGILGIGALLLGARIVFFVDTDTAALAVLGSNLYRVGAKKGFKVINDDIANFCDKVDVVLQNPPFGTRREHADKAFLEKAVSIAETIYSFHKTSTARFVEAFARDNRLRIANRWDFSFPLKATMGFHERRIQRVEVSCFRLVKE
jgi:putative methylase